MANVYNHMLCKVQITDNQSLVFKATLRGKYLIGKDAAIEEMLEVLENRYGNRSTIINRLKNYLMLNVNERDYFEHTRVINGNHMFSITFNRVTKAHYENYQALEMWGDINLE